MQKIFITGASSGIGQALATEYAKIYNAQAIIALVARRSDTLNALAQTLAEQYGAQIKCYACDVRDKNILAHAASDFMTHYGVPNIVIANAGVSSGTFTAEKADIATFQAVMDINLMGMVHTFHPFIEAMKQTQIETRQLVGVASVAGIRGLPGAGAYSASKAAAIVYLESLRVEMQAFGIDVTTIAPGYIRTPMTDINTYPMPFLMDVDIFAHKFAQAVAAKKSYSVIPWQMGMAAKVMRLIPNWLWDSLMKNAPHKARVDI
jgi:short-subunit dehydrogenase